mmetsp:Transcript_10871/g.34253  ORF Transcript_10871/g.34253 Transcript_10871/m.34253 type:complete len:99 (-) Transcript_10871:2-298(-)
MPSEAAKNSRALYSVMGGEALEGVTNLHDEPAGHGDCPQFLDRQNKDAQPRCLSIVVCRICLKVTAKRSLLSQMKPWPGDNRDLICSDSSVLLLIKST